MNPAVWVLFFYSIPEIALPAAAAACGPFSSIPCFIQPAQLAD
jgi:hypothetical protein